MTDAVKKLKELVDSSNNIVFFGAQASARNPVFRISAAPADCIIRNGNIPLR